MSGTDEDYELDCTPATQAVDPKPMDPEALDHLRHALAQGPYAIAHDFVRALLDDRDYQELLIARQDAELEAGPPSEMELRLLHATREIARLRARVRVESEDVERAGVTWERFVAWAEAGHTEMHANVRGNVTEDAPITSPGRACYIADEINWMVETCDPGMCGLDILDEMAAAEPTP
jgi:hypothetical protein